MTNVSLNKETRKCVPDNQFLGYEGENEVNKLIFTFEDGFFDGSGLLNIRRGEQKGYISLQKVEDTYELEVKNSLLSQKGDVIFQLAITSIEGAVIKFDPFVMTVKDSIDTDAELPEEYPDWITEANAKLAEIDEAIKEAEEVIADIVTSKENGEFDGKDGYSPSAKVIPIENGVKIVITDAEGTTEENLYHGTGAGGTTLYPQLQEKPKINGVELVGNKTTEQLGIEIPKNTSELNNDSGFITEEDLPEPPKVPTKTSELTNDSGFATEEYVKNKIAEAELGDEGGDIDLSGYATKDELNGKVDKVTGKSLIDDTEIERLKNVTNYDDTGIKQDLTEINQELDGKAEKSEIPTNLSDLTNDSGFATETYVDEEIAKFDFIKVVDVLPETGLPNRIYFVPKTDAETQDLFDEFAWINDSWEYITTKQIEIDLTEYAKKEELTTLATKEELATKQDKLDYTIVTITQTEYDALVSAGTVDENTYYFIKEE